LSAFDNVYVFGIQQPALGTSHSSADAELEKPMRIRSGTALHVRPLAAALASLIGAQSFAAIESPDSATSRLVVVTADSPNVQGAFASRDAQLAIASNVLTVKNCQDDGTDSLRALISAASDGDTIQFDTAQMQCSLITLSSAEIPIIRNNLTIEGPGTGETITISGDGQHRVFNHVGTGLLAIGSLRIEDGYAHDDGGCIRSDGSVSLSFVEVVGCTAVGDTANAHGGGIFAQRDITLRRSTISENRAGTAMTAGYGGGVFGSHVTGGHENVLIKYSSITDNYASINGGGALTGGTAYVLASTIDHNSSRSAAALWLGGNTEIVNSTVSSNVANDNGAVAVLSRFGSLAIEGSTITLNHEDAMQAAGAVAFTGPSLGDELMFQSSIIANNTSGTNNAAADVFLVPGSQGTVVGAANLVGSSNVWPPGVFTATSDAKLGPLLFNGGFTRTHVLLPDSPARGAGNNYAGQLQDQRGEGYPRITGAGPSATVDVGAIQFDSIYFGGFEFKN